MSNNVASNSRTEEDKSRDYYGRMIRLSVIVSIVLLVILGGGGGFLIASQNSNTNIVIGTILVLGVSVLLLLLFFMSVGFYALDLSDKGEALGLPSGSIRAMIALLLILIWVIVSVFLFTGIIPLDPTKSPGSGDAIKLGSQFYTTMSTLVVAIAAFYFGSSTQKSALKDQPSEPAPVQPVTVILSVSPSKGNQGQTDLHLTIVGKNFGTPQAARLAKGTETPIGATDVTLKQTEVSAIECKVSLAETTALGKWDVIVVDHDGKEYTLPGAFEVIEASAH